MNLRLPPRSHRVFVIAAFLALAFAFGFVARGAMQLGLPRGLEPTATTTPASAPIMSVPLLLGPLVQILLSP